MTLQMPMPASGLMPHKRPMRLIENVLSVHADGSGTSETMITAENIFVDQDGNLAPEAVVELMAQAFAAISGSNDLQAGRPGQSGYLVGVKHARFLAQARVGDRLHIRVHPTGSYAGFVVIAGEVLRGKQVIARGELKIWSATEQDRGEQP